MIEDPQIGEQRVHVREQCDINILFRILTNASKPNEITLTANID